VAVVVGHLLATLFWLVVLVAQVVLEVLFQVVQQQAVQVTLHFAALHKEITVVVMVAILPLLILRVAAVEQVP
jgi:hypothetical protein